MDLLEKLRPKHTPTAPHGLKPDATNFLQLKNQIDLIKTTCEVQLNQINFTPIRDIEKSEMSIQHNPAATLALDHKSSDDDFGATTLASSSRNEIQSWRNKQIAP